MPERHKRRQSRPRNIATGIANASEAPGGFRSFFRFSQLAVGDAGTSRKIEDIWATFLQEMEDLGIPAEARSRMDSLGANKILKGSGLPRSVTAAVSSKEQLSAIKETIKAARAATGGVGSNLLEGEWTSFLKRLTDDPTFATDDGKRILAELKKLNPRTVAKVGSNQAVSAIARRGGDPFVTQLFNKAMKRPNAPVLPAGIVSALEEASGGKLPKVTAATTKALTAEGVTGLGAGRKAAGLFGKSKFGAIGLGVAAGFEINRAVGILGREGRAKKLALTGFAGLGPSSSTEFLRDIVSKQEQVARRKVTMQKFEPELFQDVIRVLSDTGPSKSTLTSTERRIGQDESVGVAREGRSADDVQFLLDQLFTQMGQG